MSARQTWRPYDGLAHKWSDLADRRRDHFVELYKSGRWKHYYTEEQFIAQMRDVIGDAERWAKIAGPAPAAMRIAAE